MAYETLTLHGIETTIVDPEYAEGSKKAGFFRYSCRIEFRLPAVGASHVERRIVNGERCNERRDAQASAKAAAHAVAESRAAEIAAGKE